MSLIQDVIDYLLTVNGVLDAYEMDEEVSNAVFDVEKSVRTRTNHDYKNIGYDFAMEKKHRVCVFYDDTYIFGKRSILKLMTSDGTIMGTNLTPDQIPEYQKRDDVIFISEDFVVFTNIVGKGEEAFVLFPFEIHEIEENVPGAKSVIGTSPTTSSDEVLKHKFNKPMVRGIYTMIIAYND